MYLWLRNYFASNKILMPHDCFPISVSPHTILAKKKKTKQQNKKIIFAFNKKIKSPNRNNYNELEDECIQYIIIYIYKLIKLNKQVKSTI
jgi:thymidylate kinase